MNETIPTRLTTTIRHRAGSLRFTHPHVNMRVGDELHIRIVPHVPEGGAKTHGGRVGTTKEPLRWLEAELRHGRVLVIKTDHADEGDYKYSIEIDGVGTLDPSITIIR